MTKSTDIGKKRTMSFPPAINPATGRFEEASRSELIKQSIELILSTQRGERQFREDFGSNLKDYLFLEANRTELNIMERELQNSITSMEPDIDEVDVYSEYNEEERAVYVTVSYRIRDEETEDSVTVSLPSVGGSDERDY